MNPLDQQIVEELKKWNVEYQFEYRTDFSRQRVLDILTSPNLKNVERVPEGLKFTQA